MRARLLRRMGAYPGLGRRSMRYRAKIGGKLLRRILNLFSARRLVDVRQRKARAAVNKLTTRGGKVRLDRKAETRRLEPPKTPRTLLGVSG